MHLCIYDLSAYRVWFLSLKLTHDKKATRQIHKAINFQIAPETVLLIHRLTQTQNAAQNVLRRE